MFRIRQLLWQYRAGLITDDEFLDAMLLLVATDKVAPLVLRGGPCPDDEGPDGPVGYHDLGPGPDHADTVIAAMVTP